jgi:DNA helicase-2/ATP-dependent DNA helicase PcrA
MEKLRERAAALGIPLLAMARQASAVPGLKDRAIAALRDFGLLVDELTALRDHSAEEVMRKLLALTGYHDFLAAETKEQGEDRVANIDELVSAAREFDREHPGATALDFMEDVALASAVDRWKDEGGTVTLMTLHAAKGLEFPVVFIVGLEQGLLPHARSTDDGGDVEEERRLLFVGITRAERELYLSLCRVREFRGQRQVTVPSQFLAELPEEAMTERDLSESSGFATLGPPRAPVDPWPRPIVGARPGGFRLTTAAALGGEATASPASDLDALRPGVRVVHPAYGIGRIVAVDGAGPDRKGRVAFTVGGEKTFILARSPLRLV